MRGKRAFLVLTGYVVTLSLIISLIYIVLHKNAPTTVVNQAGSVLTPGDLDEIAALLKDLKQRGMLKDTLVVWGGEFGRTPMVQGGNNDGRDHHPNAFVLSLHPAAQCLLRA